MPEDIEWTCIYCGSKQKTNTLPPVDGLKPYDQIIKESAKRGTIACEKCFRWFMSRIKN